MTDTNARFTRDRLARVEAMERWHFWFRGRGVLVRELLRRETIDRHPLHLELGCGTGKVAAEMLQRGHRVVAVDFRPEGLAAMRKSDATTMLVRADATYLPFRKDSFDLITALDVIEHVDDRVALTELRRVLRSSGRAILSVPALPWLWSARDDEAGHLRRYTPRLLHAALGRASLAVVALRYYQFVLFPFIAGSRLLGKIAGGGQSQILEEIPLPVVNRVLGWVNSVEAMLAARVSLPWGSSLIAVCRPA